MTNLLRRFPRTNYSIAMILLSGLCCPVNAGESSHRPANNLQGAYVIVSWNNLGMHCYDGFDYGEFAVLPPFNTLWAQVIQAGDPPVIVTKGIIVSYAFPDNTYSAGTVGLPAKTDFWDYAGALFPSSSFPSFVTNRRDIGLAGKGLSGTMDLNGDHFEAVGIPLTWYRDQDANSRSPYPFQLARLTVSTTVDPLTPVSSLTVVAPVSAELNCSNCHADDMDATTRYPIVPTGNVKQNILSLHDYLNYNLPISKGWPPLYARPLMQERPVLCARCHASNALGTKGAAGSKSLSNAMHGHHNSAFVPDIKPDSTEGCYNCHPGPQTQCLRDTMSQNFNANCTTCHGNMAEVAANPNPWVNEPTCGAAVCHGAAYAPDQPLYQISRGHGGIYCAGCHDSPHAIAPSREANDGIKFVQLQGYAGPLRDCTVCHTATPSGMFRHSFSPPRAIP